MYYVDIKDQPTNMKDERHVGHFVVDIDRREKNSDEDEGSWYVMTRRASDVISAGTGGQLRERERGHPGVHFQVVRARV